MTTLSPPEPATDALPHVGRHAADDPDMDALLAMLEERGVDPPSIKARTRSIATAAGPRAALAARRAADADRRAGHAAAVAALLVFVVLGSALVVAAETTARVVTAWDVPGRARRWGRRARAGADRALAWPRRVDRST